MPPHFVMVQGSLLLEACYWIPVWWNPSMQTRLGSPLIVLNSGAILGVLIEGFHFRASSLRVFFFTSASGSSLRGSLQGVLIERFHFRGSSLRGSTSGGPHWEVTLQWVLIERFHSIRNYSFQASHWFCKLLISVFTMGSEICRDLELVFQLSCYFIDVIYSRVEWRQPQYLWHFNEETSCGVINTILTLSSVHEILFHTASANITTCKNLRTIFRSSYRNIHRTWTSQEWPPLHQYICVTSAWSGATLI